MSKPAVFFNCHKAVIMSMNLCIFLVEECSDIFFRCVGEIKEKATNFNLDIFCPLFTEICYLRLKPSRGMEG